MTPAERFRVRVLFAALGCVPVFLAGWFGWVQVLQAGSLLQAGRAAVPLSAGAADVQRDRREPLPGARGTIVDRHGAALAIDANTYEVRAEVRPPRSARTAPAQLRGYCADLARRLADALTRDPGLADRALARREYQARILQRLARAFEIEAMPDAGPLPATTPGSAEILVDDEVSVLSVIDALDALDSELSSVLLHLRHQHTRTYPERDLTWGLIGYLEDEPVRAADGKLLGYRQLAPAGLESLDRLEPGAPGHRRFRVDSQHRRFFAGAGTAAAPATRVESSIDLELQKAAARLLEREALGAGADGASLPLWGALVLVEIGTGDVLAAASWHREAKHLRGAAFTPYQQLYEPGSIVKPLVFALAMERGVLDQTETFDCSSTGADHHAAVAEAGGRMVRDDHGCHAGMTMHDVLVNSSNIGAVKVGSRLAREDWRQWLDLCGFGRTLALPLPHESLGGPAKKGWLEGISPEKFRKWTGASYSIGYELQVNALQMARAYLTLLSGQRRELRLVRAVDVDGVRDEAPVVVGERVFAPTTIEAITAALGDVVSDAEGATGRHFVQSFAKEGVTLQGLVAGKTGTAKSRSTVPGKGSFEVRNASFVGFAPAAAPRYLAVCVLQRDDSARFYGGSYAAPPAARLLIEAMRLEERRRPGQGPQVSATPGSSGRSLPAPETRQAGRR